MKRILILCGALALPAAVGVSSLYEAEGPGALLAWVNPQDTSVIVRRVYEGPSPDFWGTCPSPDGRYVTQTDWDTGDLAVLDLLTGQERRVTGKGDDGFDTSYAYSESACFSPDGQRIAYAWFTEPGTYELRVINSDGTNSRLVARAGFDPLDPSYVDGYEWWPDLHGWSPDGEHILATLYGPGEEIEVTLLSVADGSEEVLHVSKVGPALAALSPDGRHLAYDEEADIFVRPVSGGNAVSVASGPSKDLLLGWTENGNLLYYSDRDLTEGVWRVPMRDGRPAGDAALVAGDLWGMKPMGVAGGSLFYGIWTQLSRMHVVPIDLTRDRLSGTPTPVDPQMRNSSFPAWSPDGLKLLYWVGEPGDTEGRLMLRSTAGGETLDVTPGSLTPVRELLRWSEDGRLILIFGEEQESGRRAFFAYTLATGEIEDFFSRDEIAEMDVRWEMFSSDWETVYLGVTEGSDGPTAVLRRDMATKETLVAFPGRSDWGPANWKRMWPSPDNRSFAFWEFDDPFTASRRLKVISADGGEPRTLLTVPRSDEASHPRCTGDLIPLWTSDGRHLLSILRDNSVPEGEPFPPNPCRLYKMPVEGGDPIFLGALPQQGVWALSPDDSRLAFSTGEDRGEIWIMEGLDRR